MQYGKKLYSLHFCALLILLSSLIITKSWAQQGIQYTQYMYDGSLINPAFAGAEDVLTLNLIHRDQWSGFEGAPQSQTFTGHTLFKQKQLGTGILINRETIGIHTQFSMAANFAYHLKVAPKSFLSVGLKAGIINRQSDYQSIQGGVPDNAAASNDYRQSSLDLGLGLFFRNEKLQVGYSVPQLVNQKYDLGDSISVDPGELNHLIFGKYTIFLNSNFDLAPSVLLKYFSGTPLSYDLNLNVIYKKVLSVGTSYRRSESVDLLLRLNATRQLQIGYAYDIPIGNSNQLAQSSHEIMLRYLFKYKYAKVVSPR